MGLGGHLTLNGVAKNLEERTGLKLCPIFREGFCKSDIFFNNPRISHHPEGSKRIYLDDLNYIENPNVDRVKFRTKEHIISWTCKEIGLKEPIDLRCELYLTDEEEKNAQDIIKFFPKNYACIEPHSKASWMQSRIYPFEKYQNIVDALKDKIQFVQIGAPKSRKLNDVIYTNGDVTFRETFELLKNAKFFLSTEGGLVHLANAADTESFVIYTSYSNPSVTMYPENHLIDISLHRDKILGYKNHPLYKDEANKHDEKEIVQTIEEFI